jgi:hemolysin III
MKRSGHPPHDVLRLIKSSTGKRKTIIDNLSNPSNTKFRDPVSAWTHLLSAGIALPGSVYLLIRGWGDPLRVVSLIIYGFGLVSLFGASGIYHSYIGDKDVLLRLRKWDHSAIYLLIAGTYTPICLNVFTGFWRWGVLAVIWSMAFIGIGVKLYFINAPRWITAGVYLLMGWLVVFTLPQMVAVLTWPVLFWLILGGLFYTVGAVIYITKKMDFVPGVFGFHEVWHLFVMLGAFCHFIFIALVVL